MKKKKTQLQKRTYFCVKLQLHLYLHFTPYLLVGHGMHSMPSIDVLPGSHSEIISLDILNLNVISKHTIYDFRYT